MANKKEQLSTDLAKFVEQSQWAKAVECLQRLVELEPANANYHLRMGDYSVKAGNKSGAVKAYYRAAKLFVDSGFSVKGIATYKMILRLAPEEKQAQQLMRAINSSPAVASALVSLPAFAPEAPAPPPLLAPEAPAPPSLLAPEAPAPPPTRAAPSPPAVEAVPPPPPPPPVEVAPPPALKVAPPPAPKVAPPPALKVAPPPAPKVAPPPARKVAPPPALEPEPASELELEVEVMGSEQLEVKKDINPLFAAFSEEEFGAIVDKLEPLQFMAGERMIAEGDEGDAMYLISRGGGRVIKEIDGQEVVLDELGEGEFFGEMSLMVGGPRSASVFATADTEVLRLKSSDLFDIIKQYPRIENALEQFYDKRSKATRQKMKEVRK